MSLTTTFDRLTQTLALVDGLRVADSRTPGTPPSRGLVIIDPETITFDSTMGRGSDLFTFWLALYVPSAVPRLQLTNLLGLITDVKEAAESDLVAPMVIQVMEASSFRESTINEVGMYGCLLRVEITDVA
jgi:hypothetical protein